MKKNNSKNTSLLLVGVIILIAICVFIFVSPTENAASEQEENAEQTVPETKAPLTTPKEKTDAEIVKDLLDTVGKTVVNALEKKRLKDSLALANRPQKFAYQIGEIKDDRKTVLKALEDYWEINHLAVFRMSRGEYVLICYEAAKTEKELYDSLKIFQKKISVIRSQDEVSVIDLMQFCKLKKVLQQDTDFKNRKVSAPCFFCD